MPGYGGAAAYGYRWEGFRRDRHLVVDEGESETVRRIFDWYASGVSVISISERLEAMRIPRPAEFVIRTMGPNPYKWISATLYKILKNTIYIGEFVAFSRSAKGVKKRLHNEPVIVQVPAIITREQFDEVQARIALGNKRSSRNNTKTFYLLRALAKCRCGSAMIGAYDKKYMYYRCSATIRKRDRLVQCSVRRFPGRKVEQAVWQWIEMNVLDEDTLRIGIERKRADSAGAQRHLKEELRLYNELIAQNKRSVERLIQVVIEGIFTSEQTRVDKKRLDDQLVNLVQQRDDVLARIAALSLDADDEQALLRAVQAIKSKVHSLSDQGKRQILELCNARVVMYRTEEGEARCSIEVGLTLQIGDTAIDGPETQGSEFVSTLLPEGRLSHGSYSPGLFRLLSRTII